MPAESALSLPRRQHRTSFPRAAVREADYEFDTFSIHWLVSGMRRIERRNCHHTKPDNAAFAMVIAATIQSCTDSDDTAPITAQSPRTPKDQSPRRTDRGFTTAIRSRRCTSPSLSCEGSDTGSGRPSPIGSSAPNVVARIGRSVSVAGLRSPRRALTRGASRAAREPSFCLRGAPAMRVLTEQAFVTPASRSSTRKSIAAGSSLAVGVPPVERRYRGAAGRCTSADGPAIR